MHYDHTNEERAPFFISLVVNDLFLHNCMLDFGDSTNVMSLKVMNQLGLRITWPYRNVGGIDSIVMDVVVIGVLYVWGMLLSMKWDATLGGSLKMDLFYATIPIGDGIYATLYRQLVVINHVEDPNNTYDLSEN
jgi:hypothetical protein